MLLLTRFQATAPEAITIESLKRAGDSLVVHILFIDIVGFSKLSMEAQRTASSELATIVSVTPTYLSAIEDASLTCLDTGDGMALIFEGDPTAPAFAALEIANARGKRPQASIRMGLHSGPATRMVDINGRQNFKGVGVNVAQRVMDCACGSQITMTEHYASILRCYEGWQPMIVPLGVRTVKHGLQLEVCQLLHTYSPKPVAAIRRHIEPHDAWPFPYLLLALAIAVGLDVFMCLLLFSLPPAAEADASVARPTPPPVVSRIPQPPLTKPSPNPKVP